MHPVDWNPLVVAVAGLIVAMTPLAVAIVTLRLRDMERRVLEGQDRLAAHVSELPQRMVAAVQPMRDTPGDGGPVEYNRRVGDR